MTVTTKVDAIIAPTDVTAQVTIARGAFRFNRASGRFAQELTLTNISGSAITGPVSLVLDNLSANATLSNKTGDTASVTPAGRPYINVNVGGGNALSAGEKATVTLEFTNSNNTGISYSTRVLAGPGSR